MVGADQVGGAPVRIACVIAAHLHRVVRGIPATRRCGVIRPVRRIEPPVFRGFEAKPCASGRYPVPIDVAALRRHVVDPAGQRLVGRHHAQRKLVFKQWEVRHGLGVPAGPAALGGRPARLRKRSETVQLRLVGQDAYGAAHRAFAEQRALWATKHFDAIQVDVGSDAEDLFATWKAGETGFPIVDAGMRQLRDTGFMHNRVRM
ncbi:MAG: hypothetical protein JHC82_06550, partial [Stenotrophomonas sp.]|nr:hypothetical protein [Stenotrophomonas sp.]